MSYDITSLDEDRRTVLTVTDFSLVFAINRERVLDLDCLRCGFDYPLTCLFLLILLLLLALLKTTYLLQTLHDLLTNRWVPKVNDLEWYLARICHRIRWCWAAFCVVMRCGFCSCTLHPFNFQVFDHANESALLGLVRGCLLQQLMETKPHPPLFLF